MKKRLYFGCILLLFITGSILWINKKISEYSTICPIFPSISIYKVFDDEQTENTKKLQLLARCLFENDLEKISEIPDYYAIECIKRQLSITKLLLKDPQKIKTITLLYDPDQVNYYDEFHDVFLGAKEILRLNENLSVFGVEQTGQHIPLYNSYKKIKYTYDSTIEKLNLYKEIGQIIESNKTDEIENQIPQILDRLKKIPVLETCCDSIECKALSYFKRKAYKKVNILSEPEYIK